MEFGSASDVPHPGTSLAAGGWWMVDGGWPASVSARPRGQGFSRGAHLALTLQLMKKQVGGEPLNVTLDPSSARLPFMGTEPLPSGSEPTTTLRESVASSLCAWLCDIVSQLETTDIPASRETWILTPVVPQAGESIGWLRENVALLPAHTF
ncbi:uncharacterized protein LOC134537444 isoform X2 [Bacillus rossius redtenbacheri]|uniref:uncharacterized protein LOC134537444 isoform X2 n=1 Tax=Bacillus rossius redtenbacheri TaxID=93214 RepID=UPI002FDE374A